MGLRWETRKECGGGRSGDRGSSREEEEGKTLKSLKDRKERSVKL